MRLILVDGYYYLYRSFHAIRGLADSQGNPTNAIYGFAKAVRKLIADVRPDYAAVVWDCGLPERRTKLQPEYKQQRPEMPEPLRAQEEPVRRLVELFGIHNLELDGTEADDLIASYAVEAERADCGCVIATTDKDIYQVVTANIRIYSTAKADTGGTNGAFVLLGPEEIEEKWGVPPERIADVLCLTGDSSDNIPGVPGVGKKTAVALVREFGGLGGLLAKPEAISNPKLRDKIKEHRALLEANREMVRLDDDLPLPVPLRDLTIHPDLPALVRFLKQCEFKSLTREVEEEAAAAGARQGELF